MQCASERETKLIKSGMSVRNNPCCLMSSMQSIFCRFTFSLFMQGVKLKYIN